MKEKVLVINDDDGIRDVTTMVLQAHGYQLSEAINGRLGVEKALTFKPDLILLDIMMPEMNGFEACQKLKEDPTTREVLVKALPWSKAIPEIVRSPLSCR